MSTPTRLVVPREIRDALVRHAWAEAPNECCGLLAGTVVDGALRVERRYPLVNERQSPNAYLSEPRSLLRASRDIDARRLDLVAIYHSHPTSPAVPSATDLRENHYGLSAFHAIVSLAGPEPALAVWRLHPDRAEPTACDLVDDGPIGLIGLGLLGQAFAERLRSAGLRVVGHDSAADASATFASRGGQAASAGEVFASCETVLFCLPSHVESRAVLEAANLRAGQVVVDASTGDVETATQLGRDVARRGAAYVEATVSGSSAQAAVGEATLFVAGERAAWESCRPLFDRLAQRWLVVGAAGDASRMKLVSNLILGLNRAALAEGLHLAQTLGLDPGQTLDALRASMAYSRMMDTKGPKLVARDFTPQAKLAQHLKDVRLMLDAAARAGVALPLTETHRALLESAVRLGHGDRDNSAVLLAIEALGKA